MDLPRKITVILFPESPVEMVQCVQKLFCAIDGECDLLLAPNLRTLQYFWLLNHRTSSISRSNTVHTVLGMFRIVLSESMERRFGEGQRRSQES